MPVFFDFGRFRQTGYEQTFGSQEILPMENSLPSPPKMRRLTISGFVATALYLTGCGVASALHWPSFEGLKPNEWAEIFAGVSAPLAFLWLVLGFLQQGHELRQNAQALGLQSEELRNSVEQQRALVEATREQIDFEREALERQRREHEELTQPKLRACGDGGSHSTGVNRGVRIENYGAHCSNVRITITRDGVILGSAQTPELAKGMSHSVEFRTARDEDITGLLLECRFVDQNHKEGAAKFQFSNAAPDGDFFSFVLNPVLEG